MNQRIWFTVGQASEYANRHPVTIRDACVAEELHGVQRKKGAQWRIHRDCLDAWLLGQACAHAAARSA